MIETICMVWLAAYFFQPFTSEPDVTKHFEIQLHQYSGNLYIKRKSLPHPSIML